MDTLVLEHLHSKPTGAMETHATVFVLTLMPELLSKQISDFYTLYALAL